MSQQIHSYLESIVRRSGLSKREKADWMEEMATHLQDEVKQLTESGYGEDEALNIAFQKFGQPSVVRKKISRETFGATVPVITTLSTVSFALFLFNSGLLAAVVRSRAPSNYIPNILSMVKALPLSPSLMLGICLSSLTLLKTRCRRDRIALFSGLAVYGVLWVAIRLPLPHVLNDWIFRFRGLSMVQPWVSINTVIMIVWGLGLFLWTGNKLVSVYPVILSVVVGVWSPILWMTLSAANIGLLALAAVVRCIPLVLLVALFKVIQNGIPTPQAD